MRIKLKTKAEKEAMALKRKEQLSHWHDYFCLLPRWFDGGFVWLSYVERKLESYCNWHTRDYQHCGNYNPHCKITTKTTYRFPTTLQIRSK